MQYRISLVSGLLRIPERELKDLKVPIVSVILRGTNPGKGVESDR